MVHPRNDPSRRCLKVEEWPDVDRLTWEAARRPGNILLDDYGRASHWSEETFLKYRKGYGRWLNFLGHRGWLDVGAEPTSRITRERVAAYVEELRRQVAPWTVRGRIAELLAVARAFSPRAGWSWLKLALRRLEYEAHDARAKEPRMRSATEILDWALTVLEDVSTLRGPAARAAVRYRDALMIAILITCPILRRRNLVAITLGEHLRQRAGAFVLNFEAGETKNKKPFDVPVPPELSEYLDLYLDRFRPVLLGYSQCDRLWISSTGVAMSAMAIYHRITKVTRRAFGTAINPHLFRDCAVTFVAVEDPKHIGIAPHMLGHDSPRTTHRYYVRARSLEASRRLHDSIETLRRDLPGPRAVTRRRRRKSK